MSPNPRSDVVSAMRSCRLWHGASDEAVARLARAATVQEAPRGTSLATEGEAAGRIGVVVSGKVRVFHSAADGRSVTLETAESGQAFAAIAALAGARHPANADAATQATIAWIRREELLELLEQEPAIARTLVADLSKRLVNLTNVVQTLSLDVPARLARYLFQRALATGEATPEGLRVPLGMAKVELASALGTVPETLSRALARLRDDGVLDVRGREVVIFDVGALARLGSGYEE